ncbi:MAG: hypothetical protein ACE5EN_09255, partial [Nitrospinota bacterium]
TLGMAAEFAVASELGRRNIYAQPTFGNQKRTDLLIFDQKNNLFKVEVKAKQGREWPNCKGIYGTNIFIIFVDFCNKSEFERPDFFILDVEDWISLVKRELKEHLGIKVIIDEHNVPIWKDQITKSGKPYEGNSVKPGQIQAYKERWDKITEVAG